MSASRKNNYSSRERFLLLEILKDFKDTLDNKKTDGTSAAKKKLAWIKIAEKYNNSSIVTEPASAEQLRRLWQNIKTRQRDALTKERQYRISNGGGGSDADTDPLLVEISEAIDSDNHGTTELSTDESWKSQTTPQWRSSTLSPIIQPKSERLSPAAASHATPENNNISHKDSERQNSENEKRLRFQIFKTEHLNRERRAEALHNLNIKFLKDKHELEIKILQEKLKEALANAESAKNNLLGAGVLNHK